MHPPSATLLIRAVPNAGRDACAGLMEDGVTWKIRLAAPAVDGRANAALLLALAKILDVPKASVELVAGATSRSKRVRVTGLVPEEVCEKMKLAEK